MSHFNGQGFFSLIIIEPGYINLKKCVCIYICISATCMWVCTEVRGVRSPGAGLTAGYRPPGHGYREFQSWSPLTQQALLDADLPLQQRAKVINLLLF